MKKIAIFVEGQTEQIFVERFLFEAAGKKCISIQVIKLYGKSGQRTSNSTKSSTAVTPRYEALIYDCTGGGTNSTVISDIREQYTGLVAQGYSKILGLRDVYPQLRTDIPRLRQGFNLTLSQLSISSTTIEIVLAVMEIESWFLAEYSHFTKINCKLTPTFIQSNLGFDPQHDDMEMRPHPSDDMKNIYNIVRTTYDKSESKVNRIVDNLDYELMYLNLLQVSSFREFVKEIDLFLQ
jgi:hypothetical protein